MPIAIRFLWSTNDNLKRFLDLYDNDDVAIPAGECEQGDLCPLIPPSYPRNGRKCIGSKGLHFNLSNFIQCLMKPTSMQNNFQHDIKTANHSFSAVTRSVTKIERSLDVQNPEIFCG